MNFSFAAAKELYERNIHPRIFIGPDDVAVLRRRAQSGVGRLIADRIRTRVGRLVTLVQDAESVPQLIAEWNVKWTKPGTRVVRGLQDMALIAILDEDEAALDAVRLILSSCPEAEEMGRQGVRRLGHGGIGDITGAYDLVQPHLTESEREGWCAWAYESGVHRKRAELLPRYFTGPAGNMSLGAALAAIKTMLAIQGDPGVPPLAEDWEMFLSMLEATIFTAIGPNGYPEEDIGYGTSVGSSIGLTVEPLRRAGIFDAWTACPHYARFCRAVLHFVYPWGGYLANTGDHGGAFFRREFVLARQAQETDTPELLWLLATLQEPGNIIRGAANEWEDSAEVDYESGNIPAGFYSLLFADQLDRARHPRDSDLPTTFLGASRGIVSLRSGWDEDATFVVFDGSQRSPACQGHAHASCGHFSITAFGEYFSIDTGRYNNEQNCHSVVLIEGKSGRSTQGEWTAVKHHGRLIEFAPGELVDFAAVDSSHQHNCRWAWRSLGFVKGKSMPPPYVWVVDDINRADDWAEYWWQLQSSPENTIQTHESHATITGWRRGNQMDVHFALPAPGVYPRPHEMIEITQDEATPSAHNYVPDPHERVEQWERPAQMIHGPVYVRPRLLAKFAGYNGRILSLMLPRRADAAPAAVTRLASLPASLAVSITFPEVEDTLIFAFEHHMLQAGDIDARGHWCLVRRDRESGEVIDYAIKDGVRLNVDGRQIEGR